MTQKAQGSIVSWREDKGFGFIKMATGEDVFFHISEYDNYHQRQSNINNAKTYRPQPQVKVGERVTFRLTQDEQGRNRAIQVLPLSSGQSKSSQQHQQHQPAKSRNNRSFRYSAQTIFKQKRRKEQIIKVAIAVTFYTLLSIMVWLGHLNKVVLAWYFLIGIITFAVYAKDKSAAQNNRWRTPESNLHLLSLLGGWIGAMLAQTFLRHKSKKMPFRAMYYLTVILNIALLIYIMTSVDVGSVAQSILDSNLIDSFIR